MESRTATPIPPTVTPVSPASAMLESILAMQTALSDFEGGQPNLAEIEPNADSVLKEIEGLRALIEHTNIAHSTRRDAMENRIRDKEAGLTKEIVADLRPAIQDEIRKVVQEKARGEVDARIEEFIPVSLNKQVEETKRKVKQVKDAVKNAEARQMNAGLDISDNLDDELGVVLKPDGEKSDVYPCDLRSFMFFRDEQVNKLLTDFDLGDTGDRIGNQNRFLDYVGVSKVSRLV